VVKDDSHEGIGIVEWNNTWMKWDIGIKGEWAEDSLTVKEYIEVVGNIYENRDLLNKLN
jgi:hypothetical protein